MLQFIDVHDLSEWALLIVENGDAGVHNVTGPESPVVMWALQKTCASVSGSGARWVWINDDILIGNKVEPFIDLTMWIPDHQTHAGFYAVKCTRATTNGLAYQPLSGTIEATLAWDRTRSDNNAWQTTLPREKEQELPDKWKR
ncbi:MAG: hypothetical protein VYA69_10035 [Gemmatimonadota bacterium]|nr:hypothetical protein [Gemmatimonadota bacterium]